jgi:hypothetical protein
LESARQLGIQIGERIIEGTWESNFPKKDSVPSRMQAAVSSFPMIIRDFVQNPPLLLLPPVSTARVPVGELTEANSVGGLKRESKVYLNLDLLSADLDDTRDSKNIDKIAACLALSEGFAIALDEFLATAVWSKDSHRRNGPAYISNAPLQTLQYARGLSEVFESSVQLDDAYWPSPWELLARSIECYSSDWLESRNRKNTYLVERGRTMSPWGIKPPKRDGDPHTLIMPYPQDKFDVDTVQGTYSAEPEERTRINEKLEIVLSYIAMWENICFNGEDPISVIESDPNNPRLYPDASREILDAKLDTLRSRAYELRDLVIRKRSVARVIASLRNSIS